MIQTQHAALSSNVAGELLASLFKQIFRWTTIDTRFTTKDRFHAPTASNV